MVYTFSGIKFRGFAFTMRTW